jgi:hypothetical protein
LTRATANEAISSPTAADKSSPPRGKDGLVDGYWIDATQKEWLAEDLKKNQQKPKIVFCHEELHHTPVGGSGQGGDTPFVAVGKQASYIDNGWEIRKLFAEDGQFQGTTSCQPICCPCPVVRVLLERQLRQPSGTEYGSQSLFSRSLFSLSVQVLRQRPIFRMLGCLA